MFSSECAEATKMGIVEMQNLFNLSNLDNLLAYILAI